MLTGYLLGKLHDTTEWGTIFVKSEEIVGGTQAFSLSAQKSSFQIGEYVVEKLLSRRQIVHVRLHVFNQGLSFCLVSGMEYQQATS